MIEGKNRELYFGDSVYKQMNIEIVGTNHVIDNSMREQDTFSLTETLCDESELRFGSCLPNKISFIGRDIPLATKGMKLRPVEILEGNEDDPFYYGEYTVYSDVPTSDRTKREITAYDAMYDIINADVKQWYAGLSFPMKLRKFRNSFFSHFGITQKETTLVNDVMTVNRTLITESSSDSNMTEVDSISGKTVVEAICEINGVFGNINRDGLFEYVELKPIINPLYPANNLFPRDDLFPRDPNTVSMSGHYITFDYEDFQTKKITQLEIRPSDNTAGEKVGEAGNNYVISGNFLVSDKSGAELNGIAQNVLEVIGKVSYTPIKSSSCVGNPCLELGDPIRFNTSREIVESYILQRTLTGIQAKRDSIESHGVEFYPVNNNGIKKRVEDVENRADSLEQTADEIQEDVEEFKSETTVRFEKTENSIEAEVTRAQGAEGELSGRITLSEDAINAEVSRAMGAESSLSGRITITESSITQEVNRATAAEGNLSGRIDVEAGNIALKVDKNGIISAINLSSEQASIDSCKINLNGYVTVSSLGSSGTTNIDGARITTGKISADRIDVSKLDASKIDVSKLYIDKIRTNDAAHTLVLEAFENCTIAYHDWIFTNDVDFNKAPSFYNVTHGSADDVFLRLSNEKLVYTNGASTSAKRYKHDIMPVIKSELDPHKILEIPIVQFVYNIDAPAEDEHIRKQDDVIGILADDIEKFYPVAAMHDRYGFIKNWDERYIIPPMLFLIQEQQKEIDTMNMQIINLQMDLEFLKKEMEDIKNA